MHSMDHVGVIYGNVGITEFKFAVSDPALKRTDYIKVQHDREGWILAQVMDVVRETSLSFDEASAMSRGVDQEITDRLTAKAKVVGFRDVRGILQSPKTPFRAGIPAYRADEALITEVFGLKEKGNDDGAYIGFIKGYDIPVTLDINTLVQKHVSVLAKTGSGKSYVVGVLMEELMKRDVPIVVIDPHGEHDSLAHPNLNADDFPSLRRFRLKPRGYSDRIMKYSPDPKVNDDAIPLKVAGLNLKASDIADLLGSKITNAQMGILHQVVKSLQEATERYTLEDIINQVKNHQSNAKWNLASALEFLQALDLFDDKGTPTASLVKKGKVSVICLKGVSPDVQEIVVAKLIRALFEARKVGKVPPFMLVVEEAHNFCPERGVAGTAMSGDPIRTVASEGRKFGMGLTIISQRPAKIDKNVLSQCNTQIILKVTNPNDLKAISASVEGLTADMEDEIQRIAVGTAIVSHPTLAVPAFVEIRPRETQHGGRSVDVLHYAPESDGPAGIAAAAEEEADEARAPPPRIRPKAAPVAPAPVAEAADAHDEVPDEEAAVAEEAPRPKPRAHRKPAHTAEPPVAEAAPAVAPAHSPAPAPAPVTVPIPEPVKRIAQAPLPPPAAPAPAPRTVQAPLPPAAPPAPAYAPTPTPTPTPAPWSPPPPARAAPPPPGVARPRIALPPFVADLREATRLVAATNLATLREEQLAKLLSELEGMGTALNRLPLEAQPLVADLASDIATQADRCRATLTEVRGKNRGLIARVFGKS